MRKWFEMLVWLFGMGLGSVSIASAEEYGKILSPTAAWNHTWEEVVIDLFILGGAFAVGRVYMVFKFRARSPDQVGTGKPLSFDKALAWVLIPTAIFLADDFLLAAKGWSLWNIQRVVPAGAMEVKVTGYQWYFEYDYGNGIKTDELVVPVGQPVVLRMSSEDVIHSFGLVEYRLKEDIMPGRITYLWFYPEKPLATKVVCVEFCGNSHAEMNSAVNAVPKADFDKWLAGKKRKAELDRSSSAQLIDNTQAAR
jgi:cytochrome c oxidase subunit II